MIQITIGYNMAMKEPVRQKLDQFFSNFRAQKYKKGEVLIEADKAPEAIFYLTEGVVRRYSISPQGEELNLNLFKPISFFPMSWVLNDSIPRHYFEALTPCLVRKAPKKEVLKFLEENPDVIWDAIQRIYRGMEGLWEKMENLMAGNAENRLVSEFVILAKRFGQRKGGGSVMVDLRLTEKDLASESGVTRETVSRIIHKLEQKNLIEFKNSTLVVMDLGKLQDELLNT